MTVYQTAVFLHVLAALGLFATLGIEWAAAGPLRRAANAAEAGPWMRLLASLSRVAGPSALTLLATGIYMGATVWGQQAWIGLGLLGLVFMALMGAGVSGRRLAAIGRDLGSLGDAALRARLQDPLLVASLRLRTAVAMGIVLLMTRKPAGGLAVGVLGVAVVLGLAWSALAFGRPRSAAVEPVP